VPVAGPMSSTAGGDAHLGPLLERLRESIPDYFPEIRDVGEVRVTGMCHRAYSDICRIAIGDGRRPRREVVLKIFQGAEAQFRAMKAVWPYFASHPTWRIPRPLGWVEEGPALVMETASGTPLQDRLPRIAWGGPWLRAAEADCRRAGHWLRFYHDLGRTGQTAVLDVRRKWTDLEECLDQLADAGFKGRLRARLVDCLRPLAERLAHRRLPVSHVHGEFTLDNVLVDANTVTALDLGAETRNVVDHDIASFLNSLVFLRLTRPVPTAALRRLRQAFITGYFGDDQHDWIATAFLQGTGLADVALEIVRRRRSPVARAWLGYFLAGAIKLLEPSDGSCRGV